MPAPEGPDPSVGPSRVDDYTNEPPVDPDVRLEPGTVPYDPEPKRENTRGILAVGLVSLVALEVVLGFVALMTGTSIGDLRQLFEIVFSPSVALAGSATGFYFAGRSS